MTLEQFCLRSHQFGHNIHQMYRFPWKLELNDDIKES